MGLPSHVRLLDASRDDGEDPIDLLAFEIVRVSSLRRGDLVLCTPGDVVPGDGVVVEGSATLSADETRAAIIDGGCAVRRGMTVLRGHVVIRIAG
jgi:K+-transporting ATPase ATPase B chain